MVVTEEGKSFFVHSVVAENTRKKTSQAEYSKLFVKFSSRTKYLKDNKHITSILRQNLYRYLSLGIITSSKRTVFLELGKTVRKLFASWNR